MNEVTSKKPVVRVNSVKSARRLLSRLIGQLQRDEISVQKARALAYLANSYVKMAAAADEELLDDRTIRRRAIREVKRRGMDISRNALTKRRNETAVGEEVEALIAENEQDSAVEQPAVEIEHARIELESTNSHELAAEPSTKMAEDSPKRNVETERKNDGQARHKESVGQGTMEGQPQEDSEAEYGGLRAFTINSHGEVVRMKPAPPIRRPPGLGFDRE
jgi:hypothetical protein